MAKYTDRKKLYRDVEKERKSKVISYITGDRSGMETRIHREVLDLFVDHLDRIGPVPKITLILYTIGGDTSASWSIINLWDLYTCLTH